ncbi:MAG: glycosyltransferase family 4 protein [Planctomycetaceae bacterium]|nr:glycosyltransferase family 4 protein [Planctomycetaceae bacterium]
MHVLILCEYGTVNGGERSLLATLAQRPADIRVTVLAPDQSRLAKTLLEQNVPHVPFSSQDASGRRLPTETIVDALLPVVERLAPDVVHANSLSMGRITGILSRRIAAPCTAHLRDILRLSGAAVRSLNTNARLVAVSSAVRDYHVAQGLDAERTRVVYNGIDCETWRPRSTTGALRRELNLEPDTILAVSIGQVGPRKGLDLLVESAIENAAAAPSLHYLVLGERYSTKAESIAFEASLHARLHQSAIADRFRWLGYRDDVCNVLCEADLVIHAARQEPFGRVLLEAAACGAAIVATRVGGTPEMLMDHESALLVETNDVAGLAAGVRRLAHDADMRVQLGLAARRTIRSRFDIRDRGPELFNLWRETAQPSVCGAPVEHQPPSPSQ